MRKIVFLSTIVVSLLSINEIRAQPNKKALPAAQTPIEKSATLYGGATINGSDADFDGDLRLSMKGNTIISGTLDVCTTTDSSSTVSDRVKVPLTIKGNEITGSGTTDFGKQPVTLTLKKTGGPDSINLSGQIMVGSVPVQIKAEEVDLQTAEPDEDTPPDPPSVSVPSFNAITIKTPLPKVIEVLGVLRSEQAMVGSAGLVPSCLDMRNGYTQLEAIINPSLATGIITKLNGLGGVQAKMVEINEPSMIVKIPHETVASRKDDDLAGSVMKAITTATNAKSDRPPAMDPKTGEYEIKVRRESVLSRRVGLSEELSTKFSIGHEPKSQDLYIIISGMVAKLVDPSSAQKLIMPDDFNASEEGGGSASGVNTTYLDGLIVKNVATEVHGQTWDSDGETWK